ncbi:hypothetical protein TRFO_02991 [Tritrichomonas foetus]|uniref:Pirin N-terminal domain-containing protein n=1 Tax=Tritrichomonas foetus TaxID=1144522 RepID=A0A1J4KYE7_9EUKA|nr:hypothetical protein TRFO_02991 [Tritrichomonas foetus]|eukprot:OHT14732.1 hypothetical protein TRFO_02991 [Tritrichomonas foetus]
MSAGTGITHSEMNNNNKEECKFLQIWVQPNQQNLTPDYHDYNISDLLQKNQLNLIVSPDDEVPATLHQDAWFSIGDFDTNVDLSYQLHKPGYGAYIFILDGKAQVVDEKLNRRDGMGISGLSHIDIKTEAESRILLIEVPMTK